MPFSLTNSGASFQRLMGHILRGLEYRFALIYIDDIIIFSKSIDEHLTHLGEVFRRLREANVKFTMAHKGHAANKKDALQTKKMRCKQKMIAANKKTIAANKKDALQKKNAGTIWPVAGQGFQNTKWPAVRYFQ